MSGWGKKQPPRPRRERMQTEEIKLTSLNPNWTAGQKPGKARLQLSAAAATLLLFYLCSKNNSSFKQRKSILCLLYIMPVVGMEAKNVQKAAMDQEKSYLIGCASYWKDSCPLHMVKPTFLHPFHLLLIRKCSGKRKAHKNEVNRPLSLQMEMSSYSNWGKTARVSGGDAKRSC